MDNKGKQLWEAAEKGDRSKVRKLLEEGAVDVNWPNPKKFGYTPLHVAAENDKSEIAALLLKHAANVHKPDKWGSTALHKAAAKGNGETAALLLDGGANADTPDKSGLTALHMVVKNGNSELTSLLLTHGADVDRADKDGETALHRAAETGSVENVRILLLGGANVHKKNWYGSSALYIAVQHSHVQVVALLLKHGADANEANNSGDTVLHIAARNRQAEVAALLLQSGADPSLCNKAGDSVQSLTLSQGDFKMATVLNNNSSSSESDVVIPSAPDMEDTKSERGSVTTRRSITRRTASSSSSVSSVGSSSTATTARTTTTTTSTARPPVRVTVNSRKSVSAVDLHDNLKSTTTSSVSSLAASFTVPLLRQIQQEYAAIKQKTTTDTVDSNNTHHKRDGGVEKEAAELRFSLVYPTNITTSRTSATTGAAPAALNDPVSPIPGTIVPVLPEVRVAGADAQTADFSHLVQALQRRDRESHRESTGVDVGVGMMSMSTLGDAAPESLRQLALLQTASPSQNTLPHTRSTTSTSAAAGTVVAGGAVSSGGETGFAGGMGAGAVIGSVVDAERQYGVLRREAALFEHYAIFLQTASSTVVACHALALKLRQNNDNNENNNSNNSNSREKEGVYEEVRGWVQEVVREMGVLLPGAEVLVDVTKHLLGLGSHAERELALRRVCARFPCQAQIYALPQAQVQSKVWAQSQALAVLESLARALTLLLRDDLCANQLPATYTTPSFSTSFSSAPDDPAVDISSRSITNDISANSSNVGVGVVGGLMCRSSSVGEKLSRKASFSSGRPGETATASASVPSLYLSSPQAKSSAISAEVGGVAGGNLLAGAFSFAKQLYDTALNQATALHAISKYGTVGARGGDGAEGESWTNIQASAIGAADAFILHLLERDSLFEPHSVAVSCGSQWPSPVVAQSGKLQTKIVENICVAPVNLADIPKLLEVITGTHCDHIEEALRGLSSHLATDLTANVQRSPPSSPADSISLPRSTSRSSLHSSQQQRDEMGIHNITGGNNSAPTMATEFPPKFRSFSGEQNPMKRTASSSSMGGSGAVSQQQGSGFGVSSHSPLITPRESLYGGIDVETAERINALKLEVAQVKLQVVDEREERTQQVESVRAALESHVRSISKKVEDLKREKRKEEATSQALLQGLCVQLVNIEAESRQREIETEKAVAQVRDQVEQDGEFLRNAQNVLREELDLVRKMVFSDAKTMSKHEGNEEKGKKEGAGGGAGERKEMIEWREQEIELRQREEARVEWERLREQELAEIHTQLHDLIEQQQQQVQQRKQHQQQLEREDAEGQRKAAAVEKEVERVREREIEQEKETARRIEGVQQATMQCEAAVEALRREVQRQNEEVFAEMGAKLQSVQKEHSIEVLVLKNEVERVIKLCEKVKRDVQGGRETQELESAKSLVALQLQVKDLVTAQEQERVEHRKERQELRTQMEARSQPHYKMLNDLKAQRDADKIELGRSVDELKEAVARELRTTLADQLRAEFVPSHQRVSGSEKMDVEKQEGGIEEVRAQVAELQEMLQNMQRGRVSDEGEDVREEKEGENEVEMLRSEMQQALARQRELAEELQNLGQIVQDITENQNNTTRGTDEDGVSKGEGEGASGSGSTGMALSANEVKELLREELQRERDSWDKAAWTQESNRTTNTTPSERGDGDRESGIRTNLLNNNNDNNSSYEKEKREREGVEELRAKVSALELASREREAEFASLKIEFLGELRDLRDRQTAIEKDKAKDKERESEKAGRDRVNTHSNSNTSSTSNSSTRASASVSGSMTAGYEAVRKDKETEDERDGRGRGAATAAAGDQPPGAQCCAIS